MQTVLHVLESRFPEIVREMREAVRKDLRYPLNALTTAELYERLPGIDFSCHVLGNGRDANLRVPPRRAVWMERSRH